MQNYPLVSIITPSYNQGGYIEETILSVKKQDYQNIEHIIIDGGSNDKTIDILKKYENTYNMKWLSEPDGGMYSAINKGLNLSHGEIQCYLNSDDLYFPWTLSSVVVYFTKNKDFDLIYGDLLTLLIDGKNVQISFYPPFKLSFIQRHGFIPQPTVFWRRRVYENIKGFDESLNFVADCDYWIKAAKHFKIKKINEFLAIDRHQPDSKRIKCSKALEDELKRVRSRYLYNTLNSNKDSYFTDRLHEFFWPKLYQARFYFCLLLNSKNAKCWRQFIYEVRRQNFKFSIDWLLFIRLMPIIGRGICKKQDGLILSIDFFLNIYASNINNKKH